MVKIGKRKILFTCRWEGLAAGKLNLCKKRSVHQNGPHTSNNKSLDLAIDLHPEIHQMNSHVNVNWLSSYYASSCQFDDINGLCRVVGFGWPDIGLRELQSFTGEARNDTD